MPTIKKLQFANGTDVTEPTDLSLESSTDHLKTYADDAAYEADNGSASAGDIYINTTMNTARLYAGGQWWSVVIKENAIIVDDNFKLVDNGDNTKVGKFDVSNVPTGETKTFAVPAIATASDVLVTQDANQELKNKTIDGNLNTLTNLDFGTLSGEVNPQNGGTGISNPAGATLTRTGAFDLNITCTAETDVTMPVSGTLATLDDIDVSNLTGTVAPDQGGLGTDASAFNGVVKADGAGNFSASAVTNTDISATAAIAYSKLSIGTGDIDATKIAGGLVTDSEFDKLHTAGDNGPNNLVTCSGTQTISNKLYVEPEIFDNIKFVEQASSPSTPGTNRVLVYAKEDGKIYKKDDTGAETEIGAGGSGTGRNYLQDWFDGSKPITVAGSTLGSTSNRTIETTLWARSTVAGLTIQNNSVSPLRQTGDFLVNSSATTINSFVESPLWTLDVADLGKPVSIEFDITGIDASTSYDVVVVRYNSSGTHQEIISVAGNASTGTPASAQLPTGTVKFRGFYIAGSTSTDQYSLRLRKVSAVDDDFQIDSLFVGPQSLAQGAVITAWADYTPTLNSNTGVASVVGKWRRVGDSMQIQGYVSYSGTGAATTFTFGLPTGYTINTAMLSNTTNAGDESAYWYDQSTNSQYLLAIDKGFSTTALALRGVQASSLGRVQSSGFGGSNDIVQLECTVPISQWSSGTTTLADRAVEEYASWNGTTTVYGPSGSALPTITASAVNTRTSYTVTWQTPILSTDKIFLEVSPTGGANDWIDIGSGATDANLGFGKFIQQSTGTDSRYYGMGFRQGTSNVTSVVEFGNAGARVSPAGAYGATGVSWTGSALGYWRLRKVASGAAVGFPVSARNIVGDTSGTAVPTGMIGEVVTWSTAPSTFVLTTTESDWTNATFTLNQGIWLVCFHLQTNVRTPTGSSTAVAGTIKVTNSLNVTQGELECQYSCDNVSFTTINTILSQSAVLNVASTTTYKIRGSKTETGGTGVFNVLNSSGVRSKFYAVRIA